MRANGRSGMPSRTSLIIYVPLVGVLAAGLAAAQPGASGAASGEP